MNSINNKQLEECYDGLRELIGPSIEPFDIVTAVDEYRMYWKPEKVRIILLAESHVHTTEDEFLNKLDCSALDLPGYPKNFVRFVYCLGYGENGVLNTTINKNPGSSGFWKIFFSTCNSVKTHYDFSPVMKTRSFQNTILNRISLLQEMKKRGIWLIDASIIGINGEHKPSRRRYNRILLHCWDCYIGEMIARSSPEQVFIIGKRVGNVLEDKVSKIINRSPIVIYQPNAHINKEQRFQDFRKLYTICRDPNREADSSTIKSDNTKTCSKDKTKMTNISGHTIRTKALEWAKMKFGTLSAPKYCSKYYEPDKSWTGAKAWWIQVPVKSIKKNTHVCFLLEKSHNNNDFYCLNVPTSYLKENDLGLAKLNDHINLFLSAEEGHRFQDQRGQGRFRFEQFVI